MNETRLLPTEGTRPDLCRAGLALVKAVAFCPFQQGVQRVGGAIDALVQVAKLGEVGGHRTCCTSAPGRSPDAQAAEIAR